jgi:hypothetical protein
MILPDSCSLALTTISQACLAACPSLRCSQSGLISLDCIQAIIFAAPPPKNQSHSFRSYSLVEPSAEDVVLTAIATAPLPFIST